MSNLIDPITHKKITPQDLISDIAKIKRHIEVAPDEATEIAYRQVLEKWQDKLAQLLGAKPMDRSL